jgi:probable phosphoglycerate mutase
MTRLVLIRHGESRATAERFVGGPRSCTGLTDHGRAQAQALKTRLLHDKNIDATAVFSSNFPRAIETASIVAPAVGSLPLLVDAGWGEHDPGPECDGMTYDEFIARFGTPRWDGDPHDVVYPGGETIAEFHDRVMETLRRTVRNHEGGTLVVSCHAGVIDAVMRNTLQMHQTGRFELSTVNTSLTELVHVQGSKWRLVRYNDAAHLAQLVHPQSLEG